MTNDEATRLRVLVTSLRAIGEAVNLALGTLERAFNGADLVLKELERMVGQVDAAGQLEPLKAPEKPQDSSTAGEGPK